MASGRIFISYRRGPDNGATGRLYDRLERHFDASQLFMDVDSIPLGKDFVEHLDTHVGRCDVFLAIIGPGWVGAVDRLADPDDFVRIEIESALKRPDTLVIPVLVDEAALPEPGDLPESLRGLARRNGITIPHHLFSATVDGKLVDAIEGHVGGAQTRAPSTLGGMARRYLPVLGAAVVVAAGAYLLFGGVPGSVGTPERPAAPVASETTIPANGRTRTEVQQLQDIIGGPYRATLSYSGSARSLVVEWTEIAERHPDLLGTRWRLITDNSTEQKTVYFLYTGPFDTEAEAQAFCKAMLAAGHTRCNATATLLGDPVPPEIQFTR